MKLLKPAICRLFLCEELLLFICSFSYVYDAVSSLMGTVEQRIEFYSRMVFFKGDIFKLIGSIVICQLAGVIGSIPNVSAIPTWYAGLNKPSFTPPNWLFAPAWITLYAMMAVAAFLIWRKGLNNAAIKTALVYFVVQLILNAAWSWIFFGLKLPLAAFLEILALWIMILITTLKFRAIAPTAAIVMIPYLIWVSYASVLNYSLWRMNY